MTGEYRARDRRKPWRVRLFQNHGGVVISWGRGSGNVPSLVIIYGVLRSGGKTNEGRPIHVGCPVEEARALHKRLGEVLKEIDERKW